MKGMELMIGSLLQSMGIDPLQVKAAFEKTVADVQAKIANIDSQLSTIDARLVRIESKLETLPVEDIFEAAQFHKLLPLETELQSGRDSNGNANGDNGSSSNYN